MRERKCLSEEKKTIEIPAVLPYCKKQSEISKAGITKKQRDNKAKDMDKTLQPHHP